MITKFGIGSIVYYLGEKLTVVNNKGFLINGIYHIPCANKENKIDDYDIEFLKTEWEERENNYHLNAIKFPTQEKKLEIIRKWSKKNNVDEDGLVLLSDVFKILDLHTDNAPISYLKSELKKLLI